MSDSNKFIEDDLAILAEFVDESEGDLNKAANHFVALESRAGDLELINAIFRPLHSIKGNSAFLGLLRVRQLAHEMENLLDDLRKQRCAPNAELVSVLLGGVDELKAMLARIRGREKEVVDESAFSALVASIQGLRAGTASADAKPAASAPSVALGFAAAPAAPVSAAPKDLERTIRIPEKYLDEIQKTQAALAEWRKKAAVAGDSGQAFKDALALLSRTADDLALQLTAMRSVPAAELLQRAPRIARETAAATGKVVRVSLTGETLRLPRSLVGALESPLMHMVRNAVDHGVEPPDLRRRAGKPDEGLIAVEMRAENEAFVLRVADDGAGIDFRKLLTKAMAQGLCPRERALTPDDVLNLIFLPGLSAAEKVTDISGRGVGMDVVKNQVESAGGTIRVASKPGQGSEFIVTLPNK